VIPARQGTDLERFRSVVAGRLGLRFDDTRLAVLAEVLERRVEATRTTRGTYLDRLEQGSPPREEIRALAREVTVGETYFFRYMDQFRAFAELVRPGRPLRILSAGCATGEETYSLAMMVREQVGESGAAISILGVDINPAALARASQATYAPWSLRETPPDMRRRWFLEAAREYTVDPSIRAAVRFEERNLADAEPGLWLARSYDVVFCRNVLMYLTPEKACALVARIGQALSPGGHLVLGHAETLRGLSQDFHLCQTHDTFYYRRKGHAEPRLGDAVMDDGPPPAPTPDIPDSRWVDAVQQSAKRIRELSEQSGVRAKASADDAPETPTAAANVTRAVELLKDERFADALQALGDPPAGSARDPDALLLSAVLLVQSGRVDEAERVCHDLCRLDELSAGANYVLALCRESEGDGKRAEERHRAAAYLDPDFAMPRLHLGLLARRGGDVRSARREIEQALQLLLREDPSRILLFGGGFTREALAHLCRAELRVLGDAR
jgi:chemotaxis protein methyltransferase CheR